MSDTSVNHPLPLQALHLPEPPGFWPLAWGWWSLIATMLISVLLVAGLWRWQKRRQAAKKAAIALLNLERETITPSGAMEIVRQAVLSYYPRTRVAQLSGEEWLEFLDTQLDGALFSPNREQWLAALYEKEPQFDRDQLIAQCDQWLSSALPPKRGKRDAV